MTRQGLAWVYLAITLSQDMPGFSHQLKILQLSANAFNTEKLRQTEGLSDAMIHDVDRNFSTCKYSAVIYLFGDTLKSLSCQDLTM